MSRALQIAILAAGMGTRLGAPLPKPLTPLSDGRTIMSRQLDSLRAAFPHAPLHAVVGFKPELIMAAAPRLLFAYNPRFAETNTSKSLLTGLRAMPGEGGVLWLNGDVVFDPEVLALIEPAIEADETFVCVNTASVGDEEVKYTLDDDGFVRRLSKTVDGGLGEAVGINYVASSDRAALVEHLAQCADSDYFERGLELAVEQSGLRVRTVDISDYFVVEVDFAADLERANTEVGKTVTDAA
jgi:choline kinase